MNRKEKLSEKKRELSKNKSVKVYKKILNGKIKGFPRGYWNDKDKESGAECARYLIEVVLMWEGDEIYNLSRSQFKTYMLSTMLEKLFDGDVHEVIEHLYPGEYCKWRFKGGFKGFWNRETVSGAIRKNIEAMSWNRNDIVCNYNRKFISSIGLEYAIKKIYANNIYLALEDAYPKEFKEWEFNVKKGFWTRETGIVATRWMIDELGWSHEEIKKKLNKGVFRDMGLEGMLKVVYNNSPYNAINAAYPGEFSQYELSVPKGYWTYETASSSVKDMIENKLMYKREDVQFKLTKEDFKRFKLEYMVRKLYDGDYYKAIDDAYPGEYRRYELKGFKFREKRVNDLVKYLYYY